MSYYYDHVWPRVVALVYDKQHGHMVECELVRDVFNNPIGYAPTRTLDRAAALAWRGRTDAAIRTIISKGEA